MPYVVDLSIEIGVPPDRVWRALVNPAEVVRWDTTVVAALNAPANYPQPGQHVLWRCKNTSELLHDRPQEVVPSQRLHSLLDFGRQHLDETYALSQTPEGTHVDVHAELTVKAPFFAGIILPRFVDGPAVRRAFEGSLTNLKYYCELAP